MSKMQWRCIITLRMNLILSFYQLYYLSYLGYIQCLHQKSKQQSIYFLKDKQFFKVKGISDYTFQGFFNVSSIFISLGYHLNLTNAVHSRLGSESGSQETWSQCSDPFEEGPSKSEVREAHAGVILSPLSCPALIMCAGCRGKSSFTLTFIL